MITHEQLERKAAEIAASEGERYTALQPYEQEHYLGCAIEILMERGA